MMWFLERSFSCLPVLDTRQPPPRGTSLAAERDCIDWMRRIHAVLRLLNSYTWEAKLPKPEHRCAVTTMYASAHLFFRGALAEETFAAQLASFSAETRSEDNWVVATCFLRYPSTGYTNPVIVDFTADDFVAGNGGSLTNKCGQILAHVDRYAASWHYASA